METDKEQLVKQFSNFVNEDNLIVLALGLIAGLKILKYNDALELLEKLEGIKIKWQKR